SAATITLGGTELPMLTDNTGATSIAGPGANLLTISGNNACRVFDVSATAAISGVTISGGKNATGAGILDNGTLTVTNSTLGGNSAAFGGGIWGGSSVTLASAIVSGNTGGDISASAVTANFCAIGTSITLTGGNNLAFGANLKLGSLANNGGPTLT